MVVSRDWSDGRGNTKRAVKDLELSSYKIRIKFGNLMNSIVTILDNTVLCI